jgi:1-acyl-sn-glycerol-3-phosphate acyltransferase
MNMKASSVELCGFEENATRISINSREEPPLISPILLRMFNWYSRYYLRQHFNSVRISREGITSESSKSPNLPIVIYSNHASWWDPLVWMIIKSEFFPSYRSYMPIDAESLNRYKFFGKIGFFGVEQGTIRGAAYFLRTSHAILREPGNILAITPQGRFSDVRNRPLQFKTGLGHLAHRLSEGLLIPMAIEYVFWEERLPEVLVRFGKPIQLGSAIREPRDAKSWNSFLEFELQCTQDSLAKEVQNRDTTQFRSLLKGKVGQGGIYDVWRQLVAAIHGQSFQRAHGHL